MIKLLRRVVLLGTAGAAGWMLWSRRQASLGSASHSNTTGGNASKWSPLPTSDANGATTGAAGPRPAGSGAGRSATGTPSTGSTSRPATGTAAATATHNGSRAGAHDATTEALVGEADALTGEADALAGEADARVAAQAAQSDAAAADARATAANAETLKFASEVSSVADQIDWTNKWVPPNDDGSCPASHPVKGNDGSKIYHVPGGGSYGRTKAERCYADADAAEADGYRPSKR